MLAHTKTLTDPNGIVKKLIFEDDTAIAEAVVYNYKDRGVVCFSVQSGCPIGCVFCGTGRKFIRNLTAKEIDLQIQVGNEMISDRSKKQFMSMSMGEPMLNYKNLMAAASPFLHINPEAHLYISTVGVKNISVLADILRDGEEYEHFGLQFSLHHYSNSIRKKKLGNYFNLMSIEQIKHYANLWKSWTTKPVYFNYICKEKYVRSGELEAIHEIVKGQHLTLSVLCDTKDFTKGDPTPALNFARAMGDMFPDQDISVFDPAGQRLLAAGVVNCFMYKRK